MAETLEPTLEITVQGIGFDGEDWGDKRGSGTIRLSPEAIPENRALVEALRVVAAKRLDGLLLSLAVTRQDLDFEVPNQPLDNEVFPLLGIGEALVEAASVLHALAPMRYEDEDGDDDPDPEPDPDPGSPVAAQEEGR